MSASLISVKSELMQDYRLGQPVLGYLECAAALSSTGQTELFVAQNDGHLYDIYVDATSDTGWVMLDLAYPTTVEHVACVAGNNGAPSTVYASAPNGSLRYLTLTNRQGPFAWMIMPMPVGMNTVLGLKAGYDTTGNAFLVLLAQTSALVSGPNTSFYTWSNGAWTGGPAAIAFPQLSAWTPLGLQTGVLGVFFIAQSIKYPYYQVACGAFTATGFPVTTVLPGTFTAVNATLDAQGTPNIFGLFPSLLGNESAQGIYFIAGNGTHLPDQLTAAGPLMATLVSGNNAQGGLQLLALDINGQLYHMDQDTGATTWKNLVQLTTTQTFRSLQATVNNAGQLDAFAIGTDGTLYHVWQETASTDWQIDEIEIAPPTAIEMFTAYRTTVIFYDNNDAVASGTDVQIFTDQAVTLQINGATASLQPGTPWTGTADPAGQVTLSCQTGTLGTTGLSAWSSFMDAGTQLSIDPSGPIQQTFATLSTDGSTLLGINIVNSEGQTVPLLQGTENRNAAGDVSQAIVQSMSLTGYTDQPSAGKYLHRRADRRVARTYSVSNGLPPGRIDVSRVPDQHWQVDFTSGKPVFRHLTAEQAAASIRASALLPPVAGFLGILDADWGDVFDAVANGIMSIASWTITKVGQTIQASITLAIGAAQAVFNAVLNFVQQCVDLAEAVFDFVQVTFENLFSWLGFLFDWSDILLAKDGVAFIFEQLFDMSTQMLQYLQNQVNTTMSGWQESIAGWFDQIIGNTLAQNSILQAQTQQQQSYAEPMDSELLNSKNIVFSGFVQNMDGSSVPAGFGTLVTDPNDPISLAVAALEAASNNYQSGSDQANFAAALTYFENMAQQLTTAPDQALLSAMSGFLAIFKLLAVSAIQLAQSIVNAILQAIAALLTAIKTALTAAWNIPFVSAFYAWLTATDENPDGDQLSALELAALVIAIPGTIATKLLTDNAPFPTPADLTAFESQYTAANILSQLGLTNTPKATIAGDTSWTAPSRQVLGYMWSSDFIATILYAIISGQIDKIPPVAQGVPVTPPTPGEIAMSVFSIGMELAMMICGCPRWSVSAPSFYDTLSWSIGFLGLGVDVTLFAKSFRAPELGSVTDIVLTELVGLVYVGVAIYCWVEDSATSAWAHVASLLAALPEALKFLRLPVIALQLPYGPIALFVLEKTDYICIIVAGTIEMVLNVNTLPPEQPLLARGALAPA